MRILAAISMLCVLCLAGCGKGYETNWKVYESKAAGLSLEFPMQPEESSTEVNWPWPVGKKRPEIVTWGCGANSVVTFAGESYSVERRPLSEDERKEPRDTLINAVRKEFFPLADSPKFSEPTSIKRAGMIGKRYIGDIGQAGTIIVEYFHDGTTLYTLRAWHGKNTQAETERFFESMTKLK